MGRGNGVDSPAPGTIASYTAPILHSVQHPLSGTYPKLLLPLFSGITTKVWAQQLWHSKSGPVVVVVVLGCGGRLKAAGVVSSQGYHPRVPGTTHYS